jgi:hypothetical protein
MIKPNNSCYLPNTVRDHASYAFNSCWQKYKKHGGSCYFNATAMVTDLNPSMLMIWTIIRTIPLLQVDISLARSNIQGNACTYTHILNRQRHTLTSVPARPRSHAHHTHTQAHEHACKKILFFGISVYSQK